MKLKKNVVIGTNDFWYDLIDVGYIKPKDILEDLKDILAVEKAKFLLMKFKDEAESEGVIEYM